MNKSEKPSKARIEELCNPFDDEKYKNIDLNRLAVFCVQFLDENGVVITFENIVVALYRMFPKKFSLIGYEEYPDSARIGRTLMQLRPKYRNWAIGNVKKGFTLTEPGVKIAQETRKLLEYPDLQIKKEVKVSTRTRAIDIELDRIRKLTTFQKYKNQRLAEITKPEIFELLDAVPYTPSRLLRRRLEEITNLATEINDHETVNFLSWVKRNFPAMFTERKIRNKKEG